jgi:hypothetical protein
MTIRQFHAYFSKSEGPAGANHAGPRASWIFRADSYVRAPVSLFHEVQRTFELQLEFGAFGEIQFVAAP